MSSWNSWSDTIVNNHNCVFGGIYDQQGNPWAQTTGTEFAIQPAQIAHICKGISGATDLRAEGPKLSDRKFMAIEVSKEDNLAVMKQMGGESNTKVMAAVSLGKTCCVLAIASAGEHERKAKAAADAVGNSLRESGY